MCSGIHGLPLVHDGCISADSMMRYVRYGAAKCGSGQKNGRRAVFDGLLCALCVTVWVQNSKYCSTRYRLEGGLSPLQPPSEKGILYLANVCRHMPRLSADQCERSESAVRGGKRVSRPGWVVPAHSHAPAGLGSNEDRSTRGRGPIHVAWATAGSEHSPA